jgi:hypothetical protein
LNPRLYAPTSGVCDEHVAEPDVDDRLVTEGQVMAPGACHEHADHGQQREEDGEDRQRTIPALVAMLCDVGVHRASGPIG